MQTDVIRRISIQATQQGVAEATAGLKNLSAAQDGVAVSSESINKSSLSVAAAYERQQRALDVTYRSTQQFEKAQRTLDQALQQGLVTSARHAELSALNTARFGQQSAATQALGVVTSDLNGRVQSAAGSFGVAGQALTALGPVGLAVAATIGTLIAGFNIASDAAHSLAEKSKELREFAEATGLTTQQVQALKSEAGKFGIDSETLSSGIQKFTAGFQQLRLGTGDLLTQIRRINPALADQMQGAQDAATAFTLFGKAVSETDNIFQRNALLKAGMGKGSAIFGEFFQTGPDVAALTAAFTAAGKGIDENLIKKLALLQVEIDKTKGAASTIFASIFAENVLTAEKGFASVLLDISKTLKLISDVKFPDAPAWVTTALSIAGKGLLGSIPVIGPLITAGGGVRSALSSGGSAYDVQQTARYPAGGDPMAASSYGGGSTLSLGGKTPAALAEDLKNLVSVLGSAASPAEKLKAAIAELGVKANDAGVSAGVLARGVAGLNLDSAISVQNAHNTALGQSATITDMLAAKTLELARAQQQGAGLTKDQVAFQIQYARESALGITQLNSQIDAEKVMAATLTMSAEAATSYSIVQTKINEAMEKGAPLNAQEIADIQKKADAYAKVKVETDRYKETVKLLQDVGTQFAQDFAQGLITGKNVMDALTQSANALGKSLVDAGIKNIIKDPTSLAGYVEAGIGLVVELFSGKSAADKAAAEALKKAQDAWKGMTDQVISFNHAAAGFNLGPLTQQIQSLTSTLNQLASAAFAAHDTAGLAQLQQNFDAGVSRIVAEFVNGVPVLGDLSQKMQDANNEATGLKETLSQMGELSTQTAAAIDQGLIRQLNALKLAAEDSLRSEINANSGFGWLNDINTAIAKFNDLSGKVDPNLLSTWFSSSLQKIVDDAKLSGDAFQNLITGIPQIAGYIHEYSAALDASGAAAAAAAAAQEKANLQMRLLVAVTDQSTLSGALAVNALKQQQEMQDAIAAGSQNIALLQQVQAAETYNIVKSFADKQIAATQAAADAQAQALKDAQAAFDGFVKNIKDFINHYLSGSDSGLSPQNQLTNAQTAYSSQLALAQGGNRDALNSITQYFTDLVNASKAYYGSTAPGQAINSTALGQLQALPSQISPEQFIVNAVNAASDANIASQLTMQNILSAAFDTGNASAFAGVLKLYLPKIDTNSDNTISFAEMKTALGTNYTDGTLKAMFDKLDLNLDGKISDVELNTFATKTNTIPIGDVKTNTDQLTAVKLSVQALSDPVQLLALAQTSSNTAASGNFLSQIISNISAGGTIGLGSVTAAMRLMMQQQNTHWGAQNGAGGAGIATFALGTNFAPGGVALVGERGPEIVNLPRGSQVIPNNIAFGNDNNVSQLLRQVAQLISRGNQIAAVGHQGTIDKLEVANEKRASDDRKIRRSA